MEKDLTFRERKFCEEYLKCGRKAEAALIAGYSEKSAAVQASKLLKRKRVAEYIKALQKEAKDQLLIDENWAVLKLQEILARCMEATPVLEWDSKKHCYVAKGQFQFDGKNAIKAISEINRLLGINPSEPDKKADCVTIINDIKDPENENG